MSRFTKEDFRASMLATLAAHQVTVTDEMRKLINRLSWKRGRWTGDLSFDVLALVQEILDSQLADRIFGK